MQDGFVPTIEFSIIDEDE